MINSCRTHDETEALYARIGMGVLRRRDDGDIESEVAYLVREQADIIAFSQDHPQYGCFLQHRIENLTTELQRRQTLMRFGAKRFGKIITPELVDRLKEAIDLSDIMGRDIELEPAHNGQWIYKCPVHGDTHASARIYPDGHWWCYGCNFGGDVFDWFKAYHHLEFVDALKRLADLAGIPLIDKEIPETPVVDTQPYRGLELD